jgi:hypothetical protein
VVFGYEFFKQFFSHYLFLEQFQAFYMNEHMIAILYVWVKFSSMENTKALETLGGQCTLLFSLL